MNIYTTDIMTFFFIMLCCLCTFLIIVLGFVFYILGSARVRSALLAMSLIKTAVDVVKDLTRAFTAAKNVSTQNKNTSKTAAEFVDADFREKKQKN